MQRIEVDIIVIVKDLERPDYALSSSCVEKGFCTIEYYQESKKSICPDSGMIHNGYDKKMSEFENSIQFP